jgi:ketosteroid isomerase-like protein
MNLNERIVRKAYEAAERKDIEEFVSLFAVSAVICDEASGVQYRTPNLGDVVSGFAEAFPDARRELYSVYISGDIVVVELSLNGTQNGPLALAGGTIRATGKKIHAPCCDVWRLKGGKIELFNCYNSSTVILSQLGVLSNLEASFDH